MPKPGIEPGQSAWQADTLPRRYKGRLVPESSTRVSYTYTRWHTNVQNFMGKKCSMLCTFPRSYTLRILWKRGEIAPNLFFKIFCYLLFDFYVKKVTKVSLQDKRSFKISDVEITRVDRVLHLAEWWKYSLNTKHYTHQSRKKEI